MSSQPPKFDELFANLANSGKSWFENMSKSYTNTAEPNPLLNTFQGFFGNTKGLLESQSKFYQEQLKLLSQFGEQAKASVNEVIHNKDKRFKDPEWQNNPFFSYLKQSYENFGQQIEEFVNSSEADDETKYRMKFFMDQYLHAISPTNFPITNPEAIKAMLESNGKSIADGMRNMMEDMQNGYITLTDESEFKIGGNLAVTPGSVIFRNELIELIHYAPTCEKVYETPLLIVPPCINKYYILDLQQENSMVKYYVEQGYNVFLISWKSADSSIKTFRWEEYVNLGVIAALDTIRKISKQEKVNTIGYCVGGVILTTAALILKHRGINWINSMLHMTTMLDYAHPGEIRVYLNRDMLAIREAKKKDSGVMSGRIISQTFSSLRANELIWNYWVNNYLLGKTPQKFDILFWNSDPVDLPLPMHSFYMENLYYNNAFVKGEFVVDDITMDLSQLDMPIYLFAALKDHIVPWHSAYESTKYLKNAQVRFVLGALGHTAGVVNPVSTDKRHYWVNDTLTEHAHTWFNHATEMPGSWWKDANQWLSEKSGKLIKAPKIGSKDFPAIIDAPGEYVLAKALSVLDAQSI